jgi:serine/threonine-protein kinase
MTEDPKISKRYRELPREEPSPEIDAAILAAARRAAETRPAPLVVPSGRRRWYFPLAAAAIIVLAVAVTVQVERQQPDPELAVPPVTTPQVLKEEPVQPERQAEAPEPKPEAPRELRAQRDEIQGSPAPEARAMAKLAVEPPERWLERIAELRKQGKHEEADKALAEFRRAYPDYRISEAMLEKIEKR